MPKRAPVSRAGQSRVSAKISHLHKTEPEKPHSQHIAMAINMEKEGRLGAKGGYKPVKKGKK